MKIIPYSSLLKVSAFAIIPSLQMKEESFMKNQLAIVCGTLLATTYLPAAELRVTTFENPWQDQTKTIKTSTCDSAATVKLALDKTDQIIIGFGPCMSELSHEALWRLSAAKRAKVMDEIFSPEGGGFTVIRTPIGASDFAKGFYSYCETPDDFEMKTFSTDHDDATLIPLIHEVQKRVPANLLKIWGTPWCPPRWMKTNRNAVSRPDKVNDLTEEGRIFEGEDGFVCDDAHMKAYALYFRKYFESYRAKGIPLWMVMPQNEFNSAQNFPSCTWSVGQLTKFIGCYLGPMLAGSGVELYFGTMERPYPYMLDAVLARPAYAKYVTGAAFQWDGKSALPHVRAKYPHLTYVMSEQECGNGDNSWKHALHCWDLMLHYLTNGVSVYNYWNLALQKDGVSHWGWKQNSLVVVDAATDSAAFMPEYYMLKHLSHFVHRGAKRLVTEGSHLDALAFVNTDQSIIVMMANKEATPKSISITLKEKTYSVTLPASSVATLKF